MEATSTLLLGKPPAPGDEGDKRVTTMRQILQKGFPNGVIAICRRCNTVIDYGLEETAVMFVDLTWPKCCEQRMEMEDPQNAPRY